VFAISLAAIATFKNKRLKKGDNGKRNSGITVNEASNAYNIAPFCIARDLYFFFFKSTLSRK
jgi:hypothetical protein